MKKKSANSKKINLKKLEISRLDKLNNISGGFGPVGHGTRTGDLCVTAICSWGCEYNNQ
ncbi:hypothetical protein [Aquimarina sp. AU474]|uniref:hypothetical protein n=1 Tax=Aquimarina sp. AU474 TaxID=2108529 RepID=UPI001356D758|nr:hypothetical protein [Aquimarina sp. AU474]